MFQASQLLVFENYMLVIRWTWSPLPPPWNDAGAGLPNGNADKELWRAAPGLALVPVLREVYERMQHGKPGSSHNFEP